MARRAQTVIQRKREELISLKTIHLLSLGKVGGGGLGVGEDFGGSHGFQSKGISRKSIKRGGALRKLTAYRLLMKGDRAL